MFPEGASAEGFVGSSNKMTYAIHGDDAFFCESIGTCRRCSLTHLVWLDGNETDETAMKPMKPI
jgi:hypothetical protein